MSLSLCLSLSSSLSLAGHNVISGEVSHDRGGRDINSQTQIQIQSVSTSTGVGHNMISGDIPHDGRGRDSHLRATGRPHWQIGLGKKPVLMFCTTGRVCHQEHIGKLKMCNFL